MNSLPTSLASTGLCKCTFGSPGIAPRITSSTLGCSALVVEIVSPSQPRPAVSQTIWTSLTSGGRLLNVDAVVATFDSPHSQSLTNGLCYLKPRPSDLSLNRFANQSWADTQ